MRKRDLLRHIPGFSKVVKLVENLESENRQLKSCIHQLAFTTEVPLVETERGRLIEAEDLPVPSSVLRYLVAGTEDVEWFLHSGKLGAQTLVEILATQGKTLDEFKRILDFGCGCGRVLRHLRGLSGAEIYGADSNPTAIHWCEKYLDFARFNVNSLEPPLPYPDGMFDLIYAFSVLTHLTEPLQVRWMNEFHRILTPEGCLILSVHGDKSVAGMLAGDRLKYQKGTLVVCDQDFIGTNYCSAYHPEAYVRSVLAQGFDVVDFIPEGAKGNPPQDVYLLKPHM
ncbi:class I SAM-dependent methyltransferase [Brasilonema octagenarum UFV-E1]|uniref:Class I SAM-dependent methyltransferase n=2 Tax=Brasilonema TaxID=383614 RepID=A0A856MCF2_9CYAN|nr:MULTISPECIES: class I SAM-dependent methyltransferase [Brasilonema]NMF62599.1 class I SAM-dependent methyltransferase [Brasilonema octagenarum UFV-OR1]QDL08000.1 class I SAM-dependent methyltransferase [Brasilonema sennae CENA114]QDL14360.1 class I SAM-dependent methyltransferase [Brasilonema octagenarum UFV-E1]